MRYNVNVLSPCDFSQSLPNSFRLCAADFQGSLNWTFLDIVPPDSPVRQIEIMNPEPEYKADC